MLDHWRTGRGGVKELDDFTELGDDTANMSATGITGGSNEDYNAMTTWWGQSGVNEFTAGHRNDAWECDDNPNSHVNDTLHRIWVRGVQ